MGRDLSGVAWRGAIMTQGHQASEQSRDWKEGRQLDEDSTPLPNH